MPTSWQDLKNQSLSIGLATALLGSLVVTAGTTISVVRWVDDWRADIISDAVATAIVEIDQNCDCPER